MDRIIELTGLDHKCVREAQGSKLYEDERPRVRVSSDVLINLLLVSLSLLSPSR